MHCRRGGIVDPTKVPPFPDKNNLHQNWWKGTDKDPKSEFVQQRKLALDKWLNVLFEVYPELPYQPFVTAFFELEELGMKLPWKLALGRRSLEARRLRQAMHSRRHLHLTAAAAAAAAAATTVSSTTATSASAATNCTEPQPPTNAATNWTAPNASFDQTPIMQQQQQQQQAQQASLFDV